MSDRIPLKMFIFKLKTYESLFSCFYHQVKVMKIFCADWEGRVTVLEDFLRHDIKADNFLVVLGRKASQVSAIHAHLRVQLIYHFFSLIDL